ncbi:MAG: class I SAM-dependent methyltransferase [Nanoarchaeota archaeon]
MKESMDLFGMALLAYSRGDKNKFYFEDVEGNKFEHPLNKYFRKYKQLTKIERKIISLSKGRILDVGCGTGMYIPYLMNQGDVLGMDISNNALVVAKEKFKLTNVVLKDIFKFKPKNKFNTIVLLENNLGMGETLSGTKKLLKKLVSILEPNGVILTNGRQAYNGKYFVARMSPIWKGNNGKMFNWISFDSEFLKNICAEEGLDLKVLFKDKQNYLAEITRGKR